MIKEKIGILGCGWLGYRLAQSLGENFEIHTTVTGPEKIEVLTKENFHPEIVNFEQKGDDGAGQERWDKLGLLNHIIISVPLFSKRIDQERLKIRITNLSGFIRGFKGTLILMSSIGVYQEFSAAITEDLLPSEAVAGEKEIKELFGQVNILRLGGLMGDDRLLRKYKATEIDNHVNHVHFMDICRIVHLLIKKKVTSAVYNITAPCHPSKRAVINAQLGINNEELPATGGKMVMCYKVMDELGYEFLYPDPRYFHG